MNVSLICTVKNEEKTIKAFLDSISYQTIMPDEIVIVDGGSQDRTVDIIKNYKDKGLKIKIIVEPHANIAKGRNIAISYSEYSLIAVTDAGCQLDANWLKHIVQPFEDKTVDVVSGWYEPDARSDLERCFADLTFPKLKKIKKKSDLFLPSSRSIAFKKECWQKAGGYPEWLYTAEDTLFDINLKKVGCKIVFSEYAIVRWRVRPNLKSIVKQFYLYAKGDGKANLFPFVYIYKYFIYAIGLLLLISGFSHPVAWLLLIVSVILYLMPSTMRLVLNTGILKGFYITPISIILIDLAKIGGYIAGIIEREKK